VDFVALTQVIPSHQSLSPAGTEVWHSTLPSPNSTTPRPIAPANNKKNSFLSLPPPDPNSIKDNMETWGHMMDEINTSKTLQILLQNPNGIQPGWKDYEFQYSLAKCYSLGVGILSIVETKLNWTKSSSFYTTK